MQLPALAENGHRRRFGLKQCFEIRILMRANTGFAGRTKGRQTGLREFYSFGQIKKCNISGIRTGPAAFNVMNPVIVQTQCDI